MYKLIEKKMNIEYFTLSKSEFLYKDKGGKLYLNDIPLEGYVSYGWLPNGYIQYKYLDKIVIENKTKNIVKNVPFILSHLGFSEKGGYVTTNFSYNTEKNLSVFDFLFYDFQKEEIQYILKTTSLIPRLFTEENNVVIMYLPPNTLRSLSLLTGEYEWEVALNRHGEILKIFGVVDNTLVVCWHRGLRTFGLLGIDLASGQIRWNMDNNQLLDGHTAQLSDGNLFSPSAYGDESYYIELDIRTQQVLRYGEIPHLKSLGLRIRWINWQDNLLYFTAFYQDSFGAEAIGVLDKNSLDLLWWERVSLEKGAFLVNEAPQVAGNKLYVLDSDGTLHIFEREEGNLSSPQQQ